MSRISKLPLAFFILFAQSAFAQQPITITPNDPIVSDINSTAANTQSAANDLTTIVQSLAPVSQAGVTAQTTGDQSMYYAVDIDGSALPVGPTVIEGQAVRQAGTLNGVGIQTLVNEDGSKVAFQTEDVAAVSGDLGIAALCVRTDSDDITSSSNSGDYETCHLDAFGNLRVKNASTKAEDAAEANGMWLTAVGAVRRDTAASSSGTSGDISTLNVDANGYLWTRTADPCSAQNVVTVPVSSTADVALITATASKKNIICGGLFVASAAEVISLWEGTGTACGTGSAAIAGSTTEANGMSFAANGGFIVVGRINGITANVDTCLRISGSNRISGYITEVQQ